MSQRQANLLAGSENTNFMCFENHDHCLENWLLIEMLHFEVGAWLQEEEAGLGFWDLLQQIVHQPAPVPAPGGAISPHLCDFLSRCLTKVPPPPRPPSTNTHACTHAPRHA